MRCHLISILNFAETTKAASTHWIRSNLINQPIDWLAPLGIRCEEAFKLIQIDISQHQKLREYQFYQVILHLLSLQVQNLPRRSQQLFLIIGLKPAQSLPRSLLDFHHQSIDYHPVVI